jgi:competence protein ComEC
MLGIAGASWGVSLPEKWLLGGLISLWVAMAIFWWTRRPVRLLPLISFWLLGVAFYQQAWQPCFPPHHLVHLPQQELTLRGHLDRPSKLFPERVQLFLEVEAVRRPEGWRPACGKLLVLAPSLEAPPVGTGVVLKGHLRPPRSLKNPGTFNRPRFLAADRIFREVRLSQEGDLVFLASTGAPPLGEQLRGGIRRLLKKIDPVSRAIYLSMLLGDQGEVTPEMRLALARTGTSHLLVINGLHLSMVAAVTYFLSFWALRRSAWLLLRLNVVKVATLLAAGTVVAYAWVAGGSPSTQRAEVMVLAYLLLVFLGRPREVWSALALAAMVILCLTPLRLFSISFQLSFAAVAALIYLAPRWVQAAREPTPGWGTRLMSRAKEALAVSAIATLATAPLVAAYFQVVSLLGVVVNLVAIPLVLVLALPLGEAAVLAQALSLTPLAQGLLALGRIPLWLGFGAIEYASRLPGSAIILPTPTWLQIAACYLIFILLFAPRRRPATWAGVLLAGVVMAGSVALPLVRAPQVLEVTCLDTYSGLAGMVVTPEDRRLIFSAPGRSWPGRGSRGPGPLPAYCHWRQFRRLDQVAALNLSRDNAPDLLVLAQQFAVGGFWYGQRGPQGPASWDLWNLLGDQGRPPRSLERGRPPLTLGSVGLEFPTLGQREGVALQLSYQGRRVLIIPPLSRLEASGLPGALGPPLALLVLPWELAAGQDRDPLLTILRPERVVIYGGSRLSSPTGGLPGHLPCHRTQEGAVSVSFSPTGVTVKQWQP